MKTLEELKQRAADLAAFLTADENQAYSFSLFQVEEELEKIEREIEIREASHEAPQRQFNLTLIKCLDMLDKNGACKDQIKKLRDLLGASHEAK